MSPRFQVGVSSLISGFLFAAVLHSCWPSPLPEMVPSAAEAAPEPEPKIWTIKCYSGGVVIYTARSAREPWTNDSGFLNVNELARESAVSVRGDCVVERER